MPPRTKITREMILDAAFDLARREGHGALTARRLAAALNCSTQPVLYQFESVDEIAAQTYRRADEFHTRYLTEGLENEPEPLMALGLRYIRFAAEEKPLFRFLFQSERFAGKALDELIADPDAQPLVAMVAASGANAEQAAGIFRLLFIAVHGWASLLANNAMRWQEDEARAMLMELYEALTGQRSV